MSATKTSIQQWLSQVFGKSLKPISEGLSPEQYSEFVSEAQLLAGESLGVQNSLGGTTQTETIQTEATDPVIEVKTEAENPKVLELTNRVSQLETALNTAEQERDRYKNLFDEKAAAGKNTLPKEDATSRGNNGPSVDAGTQLALSEWKRRNS